MISVNSQRSPYSNVQIVIMANRPVFTRESFGDSQLFGLLPIANRPILGHLLEQFERCNFRNISLVCLRKDENAYAELLLQYTSRKVRLIPVEGVMTTCDIIRNKIGTDNHIFIFPIDLLLAQNLTSIFDFHISTQSLITIITSKFEVKENERKATPGYKPSNINANAGHRYFVFDDVDPTKLVTLLSDPNALSEDLDLSLKQVTMNDVFTHESSSDSLGSEGSGSNSDESMNIDFELLNGFRSLTIDCSQHLTGAFILSPECISMLHDLTDIHSIESELIPSLCKKFVEDSNLFVVDRSPLDKARAASLFVTKDNDFAYRITDYATLFIANMKCASSKLYGFTPSANFIALDGNNAGYYVEGTLKAHTSFKYSPSCVYGENMTTAEDVIIRNSVIGRHCRFGKSAKIINSVILDHVSVEEGATIRDSIVGSDSVIHSNSEFSQCIIVPRYASQVPVTRKECIVQLGEK